MVTSRVTSPTSMVTGSGVIVRQGNDSMTDGSGGSCTRTRYVPGSNRNEYVLSGQIRNAEPENEKPPGRKARTISGVPAGSELHMLPPGPRTLPESVCAVVRS